MRRAIASPLVILSFLFAQPVSAAPMKRILVLGDSLSGGFGLKPSEAYPALLANKLRAAGLNFQVTSASQTRGTSDGGFERLPAHLKPKIESVILNLGT